MIRRVMKQASMQPTLSTESSPDVEWQQAKLTEMIDSLQTGVLVCSDQFLLYANGALKKLLGYRATDDLEGMLLSELVAESDQEVARLRRKAVSNGHFVPQGWITFKTRDDRRVQVGLNISRVLWNGQSRFISAVGHAAAVDKPERPLRSESTPYQRFLVAELEKQQGDMARDLHDSLGSELAAMSLMLGSIRRLYAMDELLASRIDEVLDQVQITAHKARSIARGLMPVDEHAGGFLRAMEKLAADWTLKGIECALVVHGNALHVLSDAGTHVYRIAQEAVTNAVRHGSATTVTLTLDIGSHDHSLRIDDNGSGFDASRINTGLRPGLGLGSMMARSSSLGGDIKFVNAAGVCNQIVLTWPGESYKHRDEQ